MTFWIDGHYQAACLKCGHYGRIIPDGETFTCEICEMKSNGYTVRQAVSQQLFGDPFAREQK